jgi:hypothetical protein
MYLLLENERKPRKRRWWKTQMHERRGGSELMMNLKCQQMSRQYKNFTRMSPTDFEYLITLIGPKIVKHDTTVRSAISVQGRLAITLRFLATGNSYTSLQYLFQVPKQAISMIVPEFCLAIIEALKDQQPGGTVALITQHPLSANLALLRQQAAVYRSA